MHPTEDELVSKNTTTRPADRTQTQQDVVAPQPAAERPAFERPELRKRGELPRVTTAFGGSFTP
jgi:hypothetical protein